MAITARKDRRTHVPAMADFTAQALRTRRLAPQGSFVLSVVNYHCLVLLATSAAKAPRHQLRALREAIVRQTLLNQLCAREDFSASIHATSRHVQPGPGANPDPRHQHLVTWEITVRKAPARKWIVLGDIIALSQPIAQPVLRERSTTSCDAQTRLVVRHAISAQPAPWSVQPTAQHVAHAGWQSVLTHEVHPSASRAQ